MPAACRILRGPDAPAAQHPLVLRAGRWIFQPCGRVGTISAEGPSARRHRRRLRALAAAARPAESGAPRSAVSAAAAAAIPADIAPAGRHRPLRLSAIRQSTTGVGARATVTMRLWTLPEPWSQRARADRALETTERFPHRPRGPLLHI